MQSLIHTLRDTHPSCSLVVISDRRLGTVLASDAELDHPQEYLDAVAASASQALALTEQFAPKDHVIIFGTDAGLRLFVAIEHAPGLAATGLVAPATDLGPVIDALKLCLEQMTTGQEAA